MTRKEMITICVEDQIRRGYVKPENKNRHIRLRLIGSGLIKPMKKAECQKWYDEVMEGVQDEVQDSSDT